MVLLRPMATKPSSSTGLAPNPALRSRCAIFSGSLRKLLAGVGVGIGVGVAVGVAVGTATNGVGVGNGVGGGGGVARYYVFSFGATQSNVAVQSYDVVGSNVI